ncbi:MULTISPECIES: hypothetical protein [unclassified Streptomyces]|uniref:Integral membrane protein n=1 Tax=Streptomyces johnsoniae TaxID=3075532 RepID=A0ABU2SB45_9ACTN|nr:MULTISPECIES: hypothetical protein [unclassified Streptomyces]MDT0446122.1 hypothetical protein [Streptomyces sp. DSM 41886]ONK10719.1 hypothetical protein STBA_14420 [Streptomyces sp. MP131-18]
MDHLRHRRTGTEPVTAFSALRLRRLLSGIFLPVFLALTVLFCIWWANTDSDDSPGPGALGTLTLACALLSVVAVVDLVVVQRRLRRSRAPRE